ncbi:hypothetical protein EKO27_g7760 [Xylaria grammica]|uniref:non-specific serine/threonine protein kinase n=1 Tax=Xylaria grammica TaxID=363999 RepID=A0A439CYP2_9PEZI|nr:hypothetical protein EKO27_g7760 [Xylaria grammica]
MFRYKIRKAQEEASAIAQKAQEYLETSSYWEYEKSLGNGSYGVAILVRQKGESAPNKRRMALKIALKGLESDLETEINWLKELHGAKHIVQMLEYVDNQVRSNMDEGPQSLSEQTIFSSLARIEGPLLALEYIDGGDMLQFWERMWEDDVHMPNRMLWALYLCLIRACIGMAYPIGSAVGTAPVLETMPPDGTTLRGIKHNDIATRNVMINTGDGLGEHHIGHMFKLIDFGVTTEDTVKPEVGPQKNLFEISQYVGFFIKMANLRTGRLRVHKGFETRATELLEESWGRSYPWLDRDLAELIAECMYYDAARRPSLQEALTRAGDAVMNRRANSFPEPQNETDDAIREFVQRYILDASTG